MFNIRLEKWGRLVLLLKVILVVNCVHSSGIYTPNAVNQMAETSSTHLAHRGTSKLPIPKLKTLRLSRRQSTITDVDEDEVVPTSPIDENGKYVGTYTPRCHETLVMGSIRAPKVLELEQDILELGGHLCHWAIIGADLCVPQITCYNFSLIESTPANTTTESSSPQVCLDEYLEVFDGGNGKSRYCGKQGPQHMTSGRYLRDLYITLQLAPVKENERLFECEVSCHHSVDDMVGDNDPGNNLPEFDDTPKVSNSCWCGRTDIHEVDGEVRKSEFPWMAALVTAETRKPFCAGTLINDMFILTSAHCFRGQHRNISNVEVLLNAHTVNMTRIPFVKKKADLAKYLLSPNQLNAKDTEDHSFRYKVQKYYLHPLFSRQNRDYDVALVKLEKPVDFTTMKDIIPICLPDPGQYEHNKEGTHAVVTGWGIRSFVNRTLKHKPDHLNNLRILEKQWLDVYRQNECAKIFRWRYTHRMMCAGHKQNETYTHESQVEGNRDKKRDKDKLTGRMCSADPGSALISFRSTTIYEQIGILAYPNLEGCESRKAGPAIFIDTRQISNWINYVCTTEEAVWCSS